ncbi:hypothetical protein FHG87_013251 [Trinorchestia longiramus]|nr:hypothetical protein FHG87_013251 [Trinorchestia longiramus]
MTVTNKTETDSKTRQGQTNTSGNSYVSHTTYHQLGRLVSESAFEREDPGSNPAADMVDAARNTAWDLGEGNAREGARAGVREREKYEKEHEQVREREKQEKEHEQVREGKTREGARAGEREGKTREGARAGEREGKTREGARAGEREKTREKEQGERRVVERMRARKVSCLCQRSSELTVTSRSVRTRVSRSADVTAQQCVMSGR